MVVSHGDVRGFIAFGQTALDCLKRVDALADTRWTQADNLAELVGILQDLVLRDAKVIADLLEVAQRGITLGSEIAMVLRAVQSSGPADVGYRVGIAGQQPQIAGKRGFGHAAHLSLFVQIINTSETGLLSRKRCLTHHDRSAFPDKHT